MTRSLWLMCPWQPPAPSTMVSGTTWLHHECRDAESPSTLLITRARLLCCFSDAIFLPVCNFLNGSKIRAYFLKSHPRASNFPEIPPLQIPVGQLQCKQKKCHSAGSRENIYEGAPSSQSSLCPHTILLHPQGRIVWIERRLRPKKRLGGRDVNGTLWCSANCADSSTAAQLRDLRLPRPFSILSLKQTSH